MLLKKTALYYVVEKEQPLYYAVKEVHLECAWQLVDRGASVTECRVSFSLSLQLCALCTAYPCVALALPKQISDPCGINFQDVALN